MIRYQELEKKMKYSKQEINESMPPHCEDDMDRAHEIFYDLKKEVDNGTNLTVYETEHFCYFESIGTRKKKNGFNISAHRICDDFWFKEAFENYWQDLKGLQVHRDSLTNEVLTKSKIKEDIDKLNYLADKWQPVVEITNHKYSVLNDISKETRKELKSLKKDKKFHENGILIESNKFVQSKRIVLLRSKYIYNFVNQFFDYGKIEFLPLQLCGRVVEFTPNSMIHILNRHFPISVKQTDKQKSLFREKVEPRKVHEILKTVFKAIDNIGCTKIDNSKIYFKYKELICTLWVESKVKQVVGLGNVPYERIATLYPTEKQMELDDIHKKYSKNIINNDLSIYIKKRNMRSKRILSIITLLNIVFALSPIFKTSQETVIVNSIVIVVGSIVVYFLSMNIDRTKLNFHFSWLLVLLTFTAIMFLKYDYTHGNEYCNFQNFCHIIFSLYVLYFISQRNEDGKKENIDTEIENLRKKIELKKLQDELNELEK